MFLTIAFIVLYLVNMQLLTMFMKWFFARLGRDFDEFAYHPTSKSYQSKSLRFHWSFIFAWSAVALIGVEYTLWTVLVSR